ncbi:MAG: response regulator [Phycisphaeraceae bacterium]
MITRGNNTRRGERRVREQPAHVLLIEDDDVLRQMLADELREAGYEVTERNRVFAWFQFCVRKASPPSPEWKNEHYDAVVSDVRMPDVSMDGLEALRILREIGAAEASPPVIFTTGCCDDHLYSSARELGAAAVLEKPFEIDQLLSELDMAMQAPRERTHAG